MHRKTQLQGDTVGCTTCKSKNCEEVFGNPEQNSLSGLDILDTSFFPKKVDLPILTRWLYFMTCSSSVSWIVIVCFFCRQNHILLFWMFICIFISNLFRIFLGYNADCLPTQQSVPYHRQIALSCSVTSLIFHLHIEEFCTFLYNLLWHPPPILLQPLELWE